MSILISARPSLFPRARDTNIWQAAIAALILLGVAVGSFVYSEKMKTATMVALNATSIDDAVSEVLHALLDAETGQRGYLLTQDLDYLVPYTDARQRFDRSLKAMEDLSATSVAQEGQLDIRAISATATRKFEEMDRTIAMAKRGNVSEAIQIVRTDLGQSLMDELRRQIDEFKAGAAAVRVAYTNRMEDAATTLTGLTSLGVVAVLLLSILGLIQVARHTNALEQARQELAEANEGLEVKVAERTQNLVRAHDEIQKYAYIVSHDLRAPLVNIMGFTSELETAVAMVRPILGRFPEEADDPELKDARLAVSDDIPEALGYIRTSMTRMDALINEILKLSRLGRVALTPAPISMDALVSDCISTIRHRLDATGAEARIAGPLPAIVSDASALQQIFTNLFDNAVKYQHADRPGVVTIRGRREGAMAVFEVEDNGRGIIASDHERVFELFRRSGVQDKPGDGIGLAHVRMLTRRLGGDISVVSDGKSGTMFRIVVSGDLSRHLRSLPS